MNLDGYLVSHDKLKSLAKSLELSSLRRSDMFIDSPRFGSRAPEERHMSRENTGTNALIKGGIRTEFVCRSAIHGTPPERTII